MTEAQPAIDPAAALTRFAALIRIPTVSKAEADETDWAAFEAFRQAVAELYPTLHGVLEREVVAGHSLLYRWPGSDPALRPAVLMAHQDVVDPGDVSQWTHPAFGAELTGEGEEQRMWGRGTVDDKGALVALLEAVDSLVAAGHRPGRDILLVFGHDEETHGTGARAVAELLGERGVTPEFVLDEGGAVVQGIIPGVAGSMAAIGLAEKGVANIRIAVDGQGGHSSAPPPLSAIGRLARAVTRVDRSRFPTRMTGAMRAMFHAAGQGTPGVLGWLYRNVAVTAPLLRLALHRGSPETRAMIQTTRVATVVRGGHAFNAIPEQASAIVNTRILPGETVTGTVDRLQAAIADPEVRLSVELGWDPSPIAPMSGTGWDLLGEVIAQELPGVRVTPYTQNGATDSRSFTGLTDAVYRFAPFELSGEERGALHAVDERIRTATWLRGIRVYRALIERL